MEKFKLYNRITGWAVFVVASLVYLLTIEPTASFWDCGEYIATSYKLEVGHPPGAPLFMMIGRLFTLLAFGDVTKVALMINVMSALASSFTILFLFWSITHLGRKFFVDKNTSEEELTTGKIIAVLGAGAVGAMAYAFSDTFWFSAVEGEVYALSSLFTAVVFWAILKWENIADAKHANRWLILIAYLMGLSIGVHLLNLLAIPAIVFVYYFRKYKVSTKGLIYTSIIAVLILGMVQYGIIMGFVDLAAKFELLFVNSFGLPYSSGIIFYILLVVGGIVYGIYYSIQKKKILLNNILTILAVILIGYSSYGMILIRSGANPPIDENNPENVFALLSYLNREQYGDRPLFYGQYYNAPVTGRNETKKYYIQKDGKYEVSDTKIEYEYDERFCTFFPRMYSSSRNHISGYKGWASIKGKSVKITDNSGKTRTEQKPTFVENVRFFLKYQIGHMYFRYFMWNFAGRQNDIQGHGGFTKGRWLSGIPFIDNPRLGPQDNIPDNLKNNKARNTYFLLPLLFGIFGMIWQLKRQKYDFWILALFFFFTGVAIILYTNQTPYQPRERDYAYAGSFYVFAIWIGLSVLGLFQLFAQKANEKIVAIGVSTLSFLLVPTIMGAENWDDHDRSGRYTVVDFARNYLNSCAENAILFTFGDNDTFPLWYAQEVEGIRTDVRVVNMSLLGTDWYIDQMKMKAYKSEPLPISLKHEKYRQGSLDVAPVYERVKGNEHFDLKQVMEFLASEAEGTKLNTPGYPEMDYVPTKRFKISVDKDKVLKNGIVPAKFKDKILPEIKWSISKNYLYKGDMAMMDILAHNNWERPIYFAVGTSPNSFLNLSEYLQFNGFAYKLVPIKTPYTDEENIGIIDTDTLYYNIMEKYTWGRMNAEDVFIDQQNRRVASVMSIRQAFWRLAKALINENKNEKAIKVLDKCVELMPNERYPYDFDFMPIIKNYYNAKATEKANKLTEEMSQILQQEIDYYYRLPQYYATVHSYEQKKAVYLLQELINYAQQNNQSDIVLKLGKQLQENKQKYNIGN